MSTKNSSQASEIQIIKKMLEDGKIGEDEASIHIHNIIFNSVKNDILKWGKYFFPEKFYLPFCDELHSYLVSIATEEYTDTLAPRGHAKTTIKCFLIPIYLALEKPDLFTHFLNIQGTATKAIAVNISIKNEFETNELLMFHYGNQIGEKWTEKQFVLKNGCVFTALGAGESVRGINYRNKRPDYVVGDDLYDEKCLENPKQVEKINRWFFGAIYKAVAVGKKVSMHIQGTAISQLDLMHTLSKNSQWKFKKFQSIDWQTEKILWVENNDIKKLKQNLNDMGSIIFEREMQNNCRDDSTSIIKSGWIQHFDAIPETEQIELKIMYVDPAISTKEYADYTAKVVAYRTQNKNYYIVDAYNDKMTFHENMKHIEAISNKHGLNEVRIEAISAFQSFTQELRRTTGLPIKEITSVKDKISRLISVSSKFENYKVFLANNLNHQVKSELINQLINNTPDHDDLRDAIVGCLEDSTQDVFFGIC